MAAEAKQETKQMSNWVPLNQDGGSVGLVGAGQMANPNLCASMCLCALKECK